MSPGASGTLSVVDLLAAARDGLQRLDPLAVDAARQTGSVLVDIRPAAQRRLEGEVPGALIVERNVLEWRFDPTSDARLPCAAYDLHVIVLCSEGYTSSLAAQALQLLGVHRATDVIGGFQAWLRAGLTTTGTHDRELDLTPRELDLLAHRAASPRRVHTREQLLAWPWRAGHDTRTRTVAVDVYRLRSKLGPAWAGALRTVRGVGYRWTPPTSPRPLLGRQHGVPPGDLEH